MPNARVAASSNSPIQKRQKLTRLARFSSLRTRVFLLILAGLLPALTLLLIITDQVTQQSRAQVRSDLLHLTELIAHDQQKQIEEIGPLLAAIAQFPEVLEAVSGDDPSGCLTRLVGMAEIYPNYAGFGVSDLSGTVICAANPAAVGVNVADRVWFREAIRTQDFAIGEFQISRPTGVPVIVFGYPLIARDGALQGVVSTGINLDVFNQQTTDLPLPPDAVFNITDQNGTLLARLPNPEAWVGQRLPEGPLLAAMRTGGTGVVDAEGVDGAQRVYAFAPVPGPGGIAAYLSIGRPADVIYRSANQSVLVQWAGAGLTLMLTLGAIWLASGMYILRPVEELSESARRLADGDLSVRTGAAEHVSELGQLAFAFDRMAAALQARDAERALLYAAEQQARQEAEKLNTELESRVAERTQELNIANRDLESENTERRSAEAQLAASLEELRQLSARLQSAREEERGRLAREIHDELGGALTGIKMDIARLRKQPDASGAAETLDEISAAVDATVQIVRRMASDLRPSLLDDFGLPAAMEWYIAEFQRRAGIECMLDVPEDEIALDAEDSTAIFRIFQETLTNVARHAQATEVNVSLIANPDGLMLQVRDNGRGIAPENLSGSRSFGLAGMRERVRLLSGEIDIHGEPGRGTTVTVKVPLAGS